MSKEAEVNQASNEPLSAHLALEKNGLRLESQINEAGYPEKSDKTIGVKSNSKFSIYREGD